MLVSDFSAVGSDTDEAEGQLEAEGRLDTIKTISLTDNDLKEDGMTPLPNLSDNETYQTLTRSLFEPKVVTSDEEESIEQAEQDSNPGTLKINLYQCDDHAE